MRAAAVKLGTALAVATAFLVVVNQFVRVSAPGAYESDGIVFDYIRTGRASSLIPWVFGLTLAAWLVLMALGRRSPSSPTSKEVSPARREKIDTNPVSALSTPDSVPEWLADKAEDAPTMMRVLVEAVGSKLRRERPSGLVDQNWHRFREAGTIGGCVALALRLHVDVPQPLRTPVELAMRESLALGIPGASAEYEDCSTFLRESLLDVERPKRAHAIPVLIATWVLGVVGGADAIHDDPETIATLAMLYDSETSSYWVSAGLE
jgi:hypothetical protein